MRILKNFILILCVVSILNFGCVICSTNASASDIGNDSLIYQLVRLKTKVLKIVFMGHKAAGKTACRSVLIDQPFDFLERNPTQWSNYAPITYKVPIGAYAVRVEYWDTSGNDSLHDQVIDERAKDANFIILTVDFAEVCTPEGLPKLREIDDVWLKSIEKVNPRINGIIILGTKLDLAREKVKNGETTQKLFNQAQKLLEEIAEHFDHISAINVKSLFVSAKTGENMDQLLCTIAQDTLNDEDDLYNHLPYYPDDGIVSFEEGADSFIAPELRAQKERREKEERDKLQQQLEEAKRAGYSSGHYDGYHSRDCLIM